MINKELFFKPLKTYSGPDLSCRNFYIRFLNYSHNGFFAIIKMHLLEYPRDFKPHLYFFYLTFLLLNIYIY